MLDYHEYVASDIGRFANIDDYLQECVYQAQETHERKQKYDTEQDSRKVWSEAYAAAERKCFIGGAPVGSSSRLAEIQRSVEHGQ